MPAISIIVPVFHVSSYLRRCLDSCVYQTFRDIEVIVVDDCSQDAVDVSIMNEFYKDYPGLVRVIRHEYNKGLGEARNTGIREARGEFVLFCDGDDFLDFTACEKMHKTAVENQSDLVVCDYVYMRDGVLGIRQVNEGIEDEPRDERPYAINKTTVWVMMIKRTVITKNNLLSGFRFAEDNISVLWYLAANKVSKLNEALYFYVYRKASLIGRIGTSQSEEILDVYLDIMQCDYFKCLGKEAKNAVIFCALRKFYGFWLAQVLRGDGANLQQCLEKALQIRALSDVPDLNTHYRYELSRFAAIERFVKDTVGSTNFNGLFKTWYAQMDKRLTLESLLRLKARLEGRRVALWAAGSYGRIFVDCLTNAGIDFETTDIVPSVPGYVSWNELKKRVDVVLFSSSEFTKGAGEIEQSIKTLDLMRYLNENVEVKI